MVHLKMAPWNFGDYELGKHHFQVNHVNLPGCRTYWYSNYVQIQVLYTVDDALKMWVMFTLILGKKKPSLTNMFQIGWKLSPSSVVEYPWNNTPNVRKFYHAWHAMGYVNRVFEFLHGQPQD